MLSRIQDLPRFKGDCERFTLGVAGQNGELRDQGTRLFESLKEAVLAFDESVAQGFRGQAKNSHFDHVQAQQHLAKCKEEMEQWMLRHAPNVHVDYTKYE